VYALGLVARWMHLASSIYLVGASAMIVIAGRSDRPTAQRWEHRILSSARGLAVAALASGLVVLGVQTALFEGAPARPSSSARSRACSPRRKRPLLISRRYRLRPFACKLRKILSTIVPPCFFIPASIFFEISPL